MKFVLRCLAGSLLLISATTSAGAEVLDNGLSGVGAEGLEQLRGKVSGREDLVGRVETDGLIRLDTTADGTYFFSEAEASAHPFALYCGRTSEGQIEIRGWRAGDESAATRLKERLQARIESEASCQVTLEATEQGAMSSNPMNAHNDLYQNRAFAFPGANRVRSQPTLAAGRTQAQNSAAARRCLGG